MEQKRGFAARDSMTMQADMTQTRIGGKGNSGMRKGLGRSGSFLRSATVALDVKA